MNKKGYLSILIISALVLIFVFIIFIFHHSLPPKNVIQKILPAKLEGPNVSCKIDTDCVLAKNNEWLACDRGPCKKDYTEKDYLAVNKNWREQKTLHCTNSFPQCTAEDAFLASSSFVAKCVKNLCQKTTDAFRSYVSPRVPRKELYTIFLVGDSMTLALGPHGGTFNTFLTNAYKDTGRKFQIDNYASGSTSVLSLNKMLTSRTTYWDSTFEPLLTRDFDLILVESFAYNPLSQYGLEGGLKIQNQALDGIMKNLIVLHPNSAVVFVATIAPNKENFSKKLLPNSTVADRTNEANERIVYLKNHIAYANSHNIPVIDIYDKSIDASGNGDLSLINPDDDIHPSFKGVDFIGHALADFIYNNQILPK